MFDFQKRINQHMAERKALDIKLVYNRTKEKYPVVLTNAYSLVNGTDDFDEDYRILCGKSPAGRFLLYDDGLDIIFDAEKADGTYTHWHPVDEEEAIHDIAMFMDGRSKY